MESLTEQVVVSATTCFFYAYNQSRMKFLYYLRTIYHLTMKLFLTLLATFLGTSLFAQSMDSLRQYTIELNDHTDQIDFSDRIHLLYFIDDSVGDKRDYVVKIQGFCSKDNRLKKAGSFAQERADAVMATLLDNGFFDYQILSCDGKAGPDIQEDKVWITFFPRTMKKEAIATWEAELARMASFVFVSDSLQPGDLIPGKTYIMEKVKFVAGKRSFDRSALPYIQNLAEVLAADTTLQVQVVCHLCCPDINTPDGMDITTKKKELSQNRAREICGFLVKKGGIEPSRLTPVAKGATELLVEEKDEAGEQKNERLELVISR